MNPSTHPCDFCGTGSQAMALIFLSTGDENADNLAPYTATALCETHWRQHGPAAAIAHNNDIRDGAGLQPLPPPAASDFEMMLRILVHKVRNAADPKTIKVRERAADLLRRKGTANILRSQASQNAGSAPMITTSLANDQLTSLKRLMIESAGADRACELLGLDDPDLDAAIINRDALEKQVTEEVAGILGSVPLWSNNYGYRDAWNDCIAALSR